MLNIVLIEPEIPQNTGNIARTCACIHARLHLVEPLSFRLSDKHLKRSGCDYWDKVEIVRWPCADAFFAARKSEELFLFTGSAQRGYADMTYFDEAYLVFGRESRGIDETYLQHYESRCVRIPMMPELRSLNLSNSVAIGAYEALRQLDFPDLI